MTTEENIYICALRYALGRRTYITGVVADFLIEKKDELSKHAKNTILQDIQIQKKDYDLGMNCDVEAWERLEKIIKDNL